MDNKLIIRVSSFMAIFAVVLVLFVVRLYAIQVARSDETVNNTRNYEFLTVVPASRGSILDRNGKLLVSNRPSYNVIMNNFIIYAQESTNDNILALINKCRELGVENVDHLPVSKTAPYVMEMEAFPDGWQRRFKVFMLERDWDVDITALSLMKLLRESYKIPEDWSDEDARAVIGVRYELELRSYDYSLTTYVFCEDVNSEALAALSEMNVPGVSVQTASIRQYNTEYAAHILGTTGKMTAEEYEHYKDLGYSMDAVVGKDGFEYAFEEYLHGQDGLLRTVISPDEEVVGEYYETVPVTGGNVELTLDIDLQKAAEDALAEHIEDLRANGLLKGVENDGTGMDAEGGAVVVEKVKTGEILACASYPTYNLATFSDDFEELMRDEHTPLYNRALQAIYNPGSTYKPVTSLTAVDFLKINPYDKIEDEGMFREYEESGFMPMCMLYKNYDGATHGMINMSDALCVSCNFYFYVMANEIYKKSDETNEPIDQMAKSLGLGEPTGVEITESTGYRVNKETKMKLFEGNKDEQGLYAADAVLAGIGQSENKFTVMQLAKYVCTLANWGTRYKSTFLQRVVTSDYSDIILQNAPVEEGVAEASYMAWEVVYDGMYRVANDMADGTARKYFMDYDITVCAKTGTAEQDTGGSSHAGFICYAPASDPEIAVAVFVEKGGSGTSLSPIAIAIFDAYFNGDAESTQYIVPEGVPQ